MSGNYEVGYGKPPKDGQFQKGKSGNPRGRPRGSKNMLTQIRDELLRPITAPDGKKISKPTAVTRSLVAQALKGNMQAIQLLLLKMIPELHALEIQELEDNSERGARVLLEAIRDTFIPLPHGKSPERGEDGESPEMPH